jgi:hypothetical protein
LPDHWNKHAQQWQWIASPLRPAPEDIRLLERALSSWHTAHPVPSPQAVLLGVTPEIAVMRWPPGTRLTAIDHNEAMIREIWPGARFGYGALCANWSDLPQLPGSQDIVVGDGCFSVLVTRDEYRATVRAVRRVIREHGLFLTRFFIRPDVAETVAGVIDDLLQARIGNFHAFKWRLAMALHGSLDEGVRLADIWDAWHAAVPAPAQLASRLDWPLPAVLTIDAYRDVQTRYTFPTLTEARAALAAAFEETACWFPGYELGERCPTLAFRPRPS